MKLNESNSDPGWRTGLSVGAAVAAAVFALAGCGGTKGSTPPPQNPPQAAYISEQPASQAVPIGRTAAFTVEAAGTAPIAYQWTKSGSAIPGATSASYTTPAVALADSGSTFQVTVSNSAGSAQSNTVTLTAGPRAPAIGDLRYLLYQQVTQPGLGENGGEATDILPESKFWELNAVGTPLVLGSTDACYPGIAYDCGWRFDTEALPPKEVGLTMYYQGGDYSNFVSDMEALAANDLVVTSLDLEPANSSYAISYVTETGNVGFDYKLEVASPANIQSTADADAANGRIITAASFDADGNAELISYGWALDTFTVYETQTVVATADNFVSTGNTLSADGYVITAFGGNDNLGYIFVGTRVKGDAMPRPLQVYLGTAETPATNPDNAYYTTVVYFGENGYTILNQQ